MHDRRVGQGAVGARRVVIGDDDVHPRRPGQRDLLHRRDRAVGGEQQPRAAGREALDRCGVEPVAVLAAAGQEPIDLRTQRA
jgi:hypothetical protein